MKRTIFVAWILLASCAAPQRTQNKINAREGHLFWEYEATAGIPDGRTRTYYPSGELLTDGYYLHGQKHGLHHAYSSLGDVIKKGFFWYDVLVWTTLSDDERPPKELVLALAGLTDPVQIRKMYGKPIQVRSDDSVRIDLGPPEALFVTVDQHVATGDRMGLQMVAGSGGTSFFSARAYSVFGKISRGAWGGFIRVKGSTLTSSKGSDLQTIQGRRTLELGGTHKFLRNFTGRVSLAAPVGHDDGTGFLSSAATSYQQPTDAILSLSSTTALRSSVSWLAQGSRWVVQTDGGVDLALGGIQDAPPVFGRLNAALGLGMRSLLATLEISNAMQLNDTNRRLQSVGLGASVYASGISVKMLAARTTGDNVTLSLGSEYAF